ncbi:MAG: hypothetical protein ABIT38_02500 [Gemmatimonadaceae bacterium]
MADHAGHTPGMPMPPNAAKQSTPVKTDAATPSEPAKTDPHAGHDMGAAAKPAGPKKAADKK